MAYPNLVMQKAYNLADYKSMLRKLLPTGVLWRNLNATFDLLLEAFAVELDRFEQRVTDWLNESVPGLSVELLSDWERNLLLPDEQPAIGDSTSARQDRVHTKWTATYSPTPRFLIDYAAGLGMTITISYGSAAVFGSAVFGDLFAIGGGPNTFTITGVSGANQILLDKYVQKFKPAHTEVFYA